ncbi:MAG: hypothetical protein ACHQAY_23205, partial [Hyphomicrobiales bacterium]
AFTLMTTVDSANLGQSRVPYLTASFITSGTAHVSNIYGYRLGGPASSPNSARVLQSTLIVNGQGNSQTSTFSVMTASIFDDPVYGQTMAGGFTASNRQSATTRSRFAHGSVSSNASSITVDADLLPTGSFGTSQNSFAESSATVTNGYTSAVAHQGSGLPTYGFNQTITRNDAAGPATLGADHPTQNYVGYAGAVMNSYKLDSTNSSVLVNGPAYVVTNASGSPNDVSLSLFNGSRLEAVFQLAPLGQTFPTGDSNFQSNAFQDSRLLFGNPQTLANGANSDGSRGAYVDTRTFAARSERSFDPNNIASDGETSTVNNVGFNGPANSSGVTPFLRSAFVVSDVVGANSSSFLSSISSATVTPCACDVTRWGFWSSQTDRLDVTANNNVYSDRAHLGVWVAGLPAVNMPTTGIATYSGHVIADISNTGSQYIAAGTFTNVVNYAGSGAVTINNLDGANYTGTVSFTPPSIAFGGGLTGSTGGRTAAISGTFFQGSASSYGEMGGSVYLTGTNYLGSGIFAARR